MRCSPSIYLQGEQRRKGSHMISEKIEPIILKRLKKGQYDGPVGEAFVTSDASYHRRICN